MKLQEIVRVLYGVDQPQGCMGEEIAAMKERFGAIPAVVEELISRCAAGEEEL